MTIEEMIQSLMLATNVSEVERNKRIIALLKAGQAMRGAFRIEDYYDVFGNKREELGVDTEVARDAIKAWDAALGEKG